MEFELFLQNFSLAVGATGGLIAAFKAVSEMKLNRIQRATEHRWKQTGEAKEFLDSIKNSSKSSSALRMLDWSGRTYDISSDEKASVTFVEVDHGLRVENLHFSKKEGFIRDCFDDLYEKFELLEHFIRHNFIEFADVEGPLEYYSKKIARNENHIRFMQKYKYDLALDFVNRFGCHNKVQNRTSR
jgi:hypothetical protein